MADRGTHPGARRTGRAAVAALAALALLAPAACTGRGRTADADPAVASPAACQVRYVLRAQPAGFTADVTVTNLGGRLADWTVGFELSGPQQRLADGWGATWLQSGQQISAGGPDLAAHGSRTAGFDGTGPAGPAPGAVTLNGVDCALDVDAGSTAPVPAASRTPQVRVAGNRIVDQNGAPVSLLGVNRSGGEYSCVNGSGIWDGPVDDAALDAIAAWHVRAVRLPLNEDCWLSLGKVQARYSGARYRTAVAALVAALQAHGLIPILDLHWTDGRWTGPESMCADAAATCQKPMPDSGASTFWRSVAQTFRDDQSVVFDLFNEPYPSETEVGSRDRSWDCWLRGGSACGLGYPVAGMQQMLDAVRSTGARNVVLASANSYSRDLTGWLAHRPADPTGNLAAAWHWYDDGSCVDAACWQRQVGPVAARVPVVATEIGEKDCAATSVGPLMDWLDARGVPYLAWTWNTWDCRDGPALITDYSGTPTPYGQGVRDHLAGR
jgi:hypothetical protein